MHMTSKRYRLPPGLLPLLLSIGITIPVQAQMRLPRLERFWQNAPEEGTVAPDFTLKTLEGTTFTLSEAYAERPVVLEFGSFT